MFALIGLIILTIKIAILATFYTSLISLSIFLISRTTQLKLFKILIKHKFKTWFLNGFIISIILFWYSFSFWGYSGIGDYFCIPVNNDYVVSSIDSQAVAYFEPDKNEEFSRQIQMTKFAIKNNYICGIYTNEENLDSSKIELVVFDTSNEKLYDFNSIENYNIFAKKKKLPMTKEFKNFNENYNKYWGKRHYLLLP